MLEVASILVMFAVISVGVYEVMHMMTKRRWGENHKSFF
jgi:hypothetical protein